MIKSATNLRKSEEAVPKECEVKIRLQPSPSKPDGPEPPLVIDAALNTISYCVKNDGVNLLVGRFKSISAEASLLSGFFISS